jgi:phenylalanyl-tRNA synthetase beta chain
VRLDAHPNHAPYFHPARQARMQSGTAAVGWAGEVHPLVLRAFDVRGPAAAVVIDMAALLEVAPKAPIQFEDLVSVPVSTRDLALIVDATVAAASLPEIARRVAPLVRDAFVFDRYEGDQVPEGRVSLALRLSVADPGRTLTDEEIDAQVRAVVDALRDELGAELRA